MKTKRKYREEFDIYMSDDEYNLILNAEENNEKTINEIIFNLRKLYGYTQEEVAKKLNIKQNTLSRYEHNERQIPISVLLKLLAVYGLKLSIVPIDSNDKEAEKKLSDA